MLHSDNILPSIAKPTRISNDTATLIDRIDANDTDQVISGIATIGISDHLPTFRTVDVPVQKQKFQRYCKDYRRVDSELCLQDIRAIDWNTIYTESNDPSTYIEQTFSQTSRSKQPNVKNMRTNLTTQRPPVKRRIIVSSLTYAGII